MIIRTIDKQYRVIRKLDAGPDIRAYQCARADTADDKIFLVMGTEKPELLKKLLPCLMDLPKRGMTGSFQGSFTKDGGVWAVFGYFPGAPFFERIKEKSFEKELSIIAEKTGMAEVLMEQVFAQNLPVYLQYEALHPGNIVMNAAHGISVNFLLFAPERLDENLFPEVQKRLSDCFSALFAGELKDEVSAELTGFVRMLKMAEFSGETELFRAFRRMNAELRKAQEEGGLAKKGILVRLWNAAFRHTDSAASFLYWVLAGALLGLLVYVCVAPETAPAQRNLIQSIGVLQITGYGPASITATESEDALSKPDTENPGTNASSGQKPPKETEASESGTGQELPEETEASETGTTSPPEMG